MANTHLLSPLHTPTDAPSLPKAAGRAPGRPIPGLDEDPVFELQTRLRAVGMMLRSEIPEWRALQAAIEPLLPSEAERDALFEAGTPTLPLSVWGDVDPLVLLTCQLLAQIEATRSASEQQPWPQTRPAEELRAELEAAGKP
jgi:hypothetical protein